MENLLNLTGAPDGKASPAVNDRLNFPDALQRRLFCWLERDAGRGTGSQRIEGSEVAFATDVGQKRTENQDRVIVLRSGTAYGPEHLLMVVCDGMGGMQDGRVCASVAASGIVVAFLRLSALPIEARLQESARVANQLVFLAYGGRGGATVSAVSASSSGEVIGLNVGDSRIYGFTDGKITPLSVDDTIAGQIGGDRRDREAHSLLQFIGLGPDIEPHIVGIPPGTERLIVTTDGAHFMPQEAMSLLVGCASSATEVCRRLVKSAQWMGSQDNATAACLNVPLHLTALDVDRSIRLWDPWGELHLLAPTDHRPTVVRGDEVPLVVSRPGPAEPTQPPAAENQARHGRGSSRKASRDKGRSPVLLPLQPAGERPQPDGEIIDIIEGST